MINGTIRGLCCEPRCKNLRRKDRHRCHRHDTARKRKKNPMRYAYENLRGHAKARGIHFNLPFPIFRKFALQTNYLNRTGNGAKCLTVDRIINTKGYVKNNIQALTRSKNSEKKARQDAIRMAAGYKWQEKYARNHRH